MSTSNKPTVQQAAKQGNPQAIAILLNRQLQPKGITAKVSVQASCLQIMLEATTVPNQKGLVTALKKWIDTLGIDSIQEVQIYAQQTGEDIPAWSDSFEVVRQLEEPKVYMFPLKKIFFGLVSVFALFGIIGIVNTRYLADKNNSKAKLREDISACQMKDLYAKAIPVFEQAVVDFGQSQQGDSAKERAKFYRGELQKSIEACNRVKVWETKYGESAE